MIWLFIWLKRLGPVCESWSQDKSNSFYSFPSSLSLQSHEYNHEPESDDDDDDDDFDDGDDDDD